MKIFKILAKNHEILVIRRMVLSEGFQLSDEFFSKARVTDNGLKFRPIFFPDKFINHGKPEEQNIDAA